jgi:hypothetical protein
MGAYTVAPLGDSFTALSTISPSFLTANIARMRYARPTPIQRHARGPSILVIQGCFWGSLWGH